MCFKYIPGFIILYVAKENARLTQDIILCAHGNFHGSFNLFYNFGEIKKRKYSFLRGFCRLTEIIFSVVHTQILSFKILSNFSCRYFFSQLKKKSRQKAAKKEFQTSYLRTPFSLQWLSLSSASEMG